LSKSLKNGEVFCLESQWDVSSDLPRQSVLPLMNVLNASYTEAQVSYLSCNTREEFLYNLGLSKGRYGILYISAHGRAGEIELHSGNLTLDEIAKAMGKKFRRCGVHFASCSTLNIEEAVAKKFIKDTSVSFISGYSKDIFWIPSAGVDLTYLDFMMEGYENPEKAYKKMLSYISPSDETIGFRFIGV